MYEALILFHRNRKTILKKIIVTCGILDCPQKKNHGRDK